MDYTSISVAAKRFEKKANNDKEISEMPKKITKKIEERISCQMQRRAPYSSRKYPLRVGSSNPACFK